MAKKPVKVIRATLLSFTIVLLACSSTVNKNLDKMKKNYPKGTFGSDVEFFKNKNIKTIELKNKSSRASVLIIPGYQGRVMTSSVDGNDGMSFGWINYKHIESGKVSNQFNPYGGEERLWLGPEGGQFSIYFKKGLNQVFENWVVPKELDTLPFEVVSQSDDKVSFKKDFALTNASGTKFDIGIERTVKLLTSGDAERALGMPVDSALSFVAYESENALINKGFSAWTDKTGALSLWMLSMFNPSPKGVVFIPFKKETGNAGNIVNDDYFGKVPADRLIIKNGILFFKTDGKSRSKIGISPLGALPYCGSYDPEKKVLTLLWYSTPGKTAKYVNSKWGDQTFPFNGDVVNSYNDGPVADGSIMGPFYEIESSSPAAFLNSGERIIHSQRIFHITGDESRLTLLTQKLFNTTLSEIKEAFEK